MTTTEHPTDPLAASFAVLLRGPLTELYALLWRVGLLEVVTTERAPRRASRRSGVRRYPAPVPSRPEYTRATG
ncbi:Rv1535 domain-containing protein [Mycobacterium sp. ML4]